MIRVSFFRRRRWFDDIIDEFEEIFREMDRMVRRFLETEDIGYRATRIEPGKPIVYGFRVTIGPDGRPVVEEFGNVKRVGRRAVIEEATEPLVDVMEEEDKIIVIAELPGVEKEKIDLRIKDNKLIIKASNKNRRYYKEVTLPAKVKEETAKARYKNGVLEVSFEKEKVKE